MLGRPKSNIKWDEVDHLLISGCSGAEIAGFIGVERRTIYERCVDEKGMSFSDYSQLMKAKGNSLLRAQQFAKALGKTDKGDNTLLIWLGKQRLEQRDKPRDEENNDIRSLLIDAIKSIDEASRAREAGKSEVEA